MGSKTPEGHQQVPDARSNDLESTNGNPKLAQQGSESADLDRGVIDDEDDDEDEDEITPTINPGTPGDEKKKKRKRSKKKKKKKKTDVASTFFDLTDPNPPQAALSSVFTNGNYPAGELVPYENTARITAEETRYNSRLWDAGFLAEYRQAAEIHSRARQYAKAHLIKPDASLLSIANGIEDIVRSLCGHQGLDTGDGLKAGMGFPTGLCLNNVTAHWTPNPGQKDVILGRDDVLKVDFGVHVNGRIVDSAFTVAFDHTYDNLLAAVKAATNTGIKEAGVDARISEIGASIQEVMECYEIELQGKTLLIKAIRNITGHDIGRYQIHGAKQVPFVKNNSDVKMEEGEIFAIETFGSTGRGRTFDDVGIYGYGRNKEMSGANLRLLSARSLLKTIDSNFSTLVFCRRYLERLGIKSYHLEMRHLIDNGIMEQYGVLSDVKGSYTAQWEHTILLHEGGKEVISRRDDY